MIVSRIYLHNFRNYVTSLFEFDAGINVILGPNGVGKTNLLEAISYLSIPKSFRGVKDTELIRWGENGFDIKGEIESGLTPHILEVHFHNGVKNFMIDGKKIGTFSEIFRIFVSLVVTAKDQEIVDGPPEARRKNLDYFGSFYDPYYYQLLLAYRRTLKEKNSLLKKNPPIEQVVPWNMKLYELGVEIVNARERFIRMIENVMNVRIRELGVHDRIEFLYEPSIDGLKEYTVERFEEERRNGFSLVGPHRDRITINYMGYPVQVSASEGQKRLILLALFLTERELIGDKIGELPVLILDEPLSVLGEDKTSMLLAHLDGQVFISSVRKISGFHLIEIGTLEERV